MKRMIIALGFLGVTLGLLAETRTSAMPCTGVITNYYADDQCLTWVGRRMELCWGTTSSGTPGPYMTEERFCCDTSCCEEGETPCSPA